MKLTFTIFFFCLIGIVSYSQRIEVTVGPIMDPKQIRSEAGIPLMALVTPFKSFSYSSTLFFNPASKRTYTGFGFRNKSFKFAVLENYLTYTGIKELAAENIDEKVSILAFMFLKGKLYAVIGQKFPDRDEFSVYVNEVSDDMVLLGTPVVVQKFKDLKKYGMNVSVTASEEKEYILIARLHDTKPKEKQKVECKVVDPSFNEVWYKLIETENMDKDLELRSIALDKNANMHMLVETHVGKIDQPIIYSYFHESKSLKSFKLGLATGKNFGTRLRLLNSEKPYAVGLNKDEKSVSYFMNRIDVKSQTLEDLGSTSMPPDFYEASNVRMFDTFDWSVSDIITLEDNSIVASIEAVLVDTKYRIHHTYNTYVVSFNESGKQKWSKVVQKKQAVMSGLDGHALLPAGNNVLVLYNDHKENASKKPEDTKVEVFKSKDAMVMVQEIDATGTVKKYPFSTNKEFEGYALFFNAMDKIQKGLYYSSSINIKGMMSVESRNITFQIK